MARVRRSGLANRESAAEEGEEGGVLDVGEPRRRGMTGGASVRFQGYLVVSRRVSTRDLGSILSHGEQAKGGKRRKALLRERASLGTAASLNPSSFLLQFCPCTSAVRDLPTSSRAPNKETLRGACRHRRVVQEHKERYSEISRASRLTVMALREDLELKGERGTRFELAKARGGVL
jgi:hypothetical protein